jgi:hypothetical protein
MALFSAFSDKNTDQSTKITSVSDSGNRTTSVTSNESEKGNVTLTFPSQGGGIMEWAPLVLAAAVIFGLVLVMIKNDR